MRRKFFDNKTCDFCKQKATTFRFAKKGKHMLCDSKECDFKSRIKLNLIDTEEEWKKGGK